ncbi:glycosyltransferase [Microbacterium aerolatum]|uniref:Glycosyl transferase n=1 Tax=Microbacterium aerolatum TaxID=153731 RepID=A0A511A9R3_9MICO|nr:glycosyltransferase [Microbacterium aerolatum]GEK84929.1 glycosyl transferase [Microbacterium aerolatum]GGB37281.1 glycosyl transferase [Microbacterium aerolatum]
MGAQLRVVLDQASTVVDADQARAARDLTAGLIATAPRDCTVDAIVPSGADVDIEGIDEVRKLPLGRRELAASWQIGLAPGVGAGLIHAPSLMAPLVKHDRLHDNHQIAVTVWDLNAWEAPQTLPKSTVAWQRGMLRRAAKHADAVIVPTHAMAERIAEFAKLGDRVRVIAGAPPSGFVAPVDGVGRRRTLSLPDRYIVLSGSQERLEHGFRAASAADVDAVVMDAADGTEPQLADLAAAAGLPERRAHVRGVLPAEDRAAVLAGASAFVATNTLAAWPWRAMEALAVGAPIVAVDSGMHRDTIAEGGVLVTIDDLTDAVTEALGGAAQRLGVLAADRAKAFSWASSAERVWALHADL